MSFFDYKMISKKGYMEVLETFYLGTHMEVCQVGPLYTTVIINFFICLNIIFSLRFSILECTCFYLKFQFSDNFRNSIISKIFSPNASCKRFWYSSLIVILIISKLTPKNTPSAQKNLTWYQPVGISVPIHFI